MKDKNVHAARTTTTKTKNNLVILLYATITGNMKIKLFFDRAYGQIENILYEKKKLYGRIHNIKLHHSIKTLSFPESELCGSRKYPYFSHRRERNFRGGRKARRPTNLKKCIKFNWKFQRVGDSYKKSLLWGRYGYFLELHIF